MLKVRPNVSTVSGKSGITLIYANLRGGQIALIRSYY